jgi:predicted amidohydrolase
MRTTTQEVKTVEPSVETTFRVAAAQMVATPDMDENLAQAESLIAQAAAQGARLVALPEYFCLMGMQDGDKVAVRETETGAGQDIGRMQRFLHDQALRHRVWLVGGTIPVDCGMEDKVYNTTLVFDPEGRRIARYDKLHLFSYRNDAEAYDEGRTIFPGKGVQTFDLPIGKAGLSICYDLRFPELYRAMGDCVLILVPAAFTATTGKAHWEVLLRARAIENQCYVLAAAQGGKHPNGRSTFGHTMLVDPWGKVLACKEDDGPGVVLGDIDLEYLQAVRASLPALSHRRLS